MRWATFGKGVSQESCQGQLAYAIAALAEEMAPGQLRGSFSFW
jgi:hypothetical protein